MRASPWIVAAVALSACQAPPEVCHPGQASVPVADVKDPIAGLHVHAHSHNDYLQAHPLTDALSHHFYSVEADCFFQRGEVVVSHLGLFSKGTLKDLYLDPLQARVNAKGSVYGDGVPFTLVVEFKENTTGLKNAMQDLLSRYPMLSTSTDSSFVERPVTVIFTGVHAAEVDFGKLFPSRNARTDSGDIHLDDPPANDYWTNYSLAWSEYIQWNGKGSIPAEQQKRLACIMENAHALGRKVRFYDSPATEAAWNAQLTAGVDFIGTDDLAALDAYLSSH